MSFTIHVAPWFLPGLLGFFLGAFCAAIVVLLAIAHDMRGLNI